MLLTRIKKLMQLSKENIREKEFHNNLQSQKKGRFEDIFYKALFNANEDFFEHLKIMSGQINFRLWLRDRKYC